MPTETIREKIIMQVIDTIAAECPSINGVSWGVAIDPVVDLPWAWVSDEDERYDSEGGTTAQFLNTLSLRVLVAFKYGPEETPEVRGNQLLGELWGALLKDQKRGWNKDNSTPLALTTLPTESRVIPLPEAEWVGALLMWWDVNYFVSRTSFYSH